MATVTSTSIPQGALRNRKLQQQQQQPPSAAPPADSPISSGSTTPSFLPDGPIKEAKKDLSIESLLAEAGAKPGATSVDDWPVPADTDWTQPASTLLRDGTARAHVNAENSAGAVALTQGQLDLQEYVRWLAILWRVYE